MQTKNYDTIGFIRASQYRGEILKILSEDMKLPSEIAYDLKKYELIRCLNENAKKGRLYEITPYGEDILNYIDI